MKKKIFATMLAACAVLAAAALAGCDGLSVDGSDSTVNSSSAAETVDYKIHVNTTEAVVFTATGDVLTLAGSTSLKDYLDALKSAGQIDYEVKDSTYGYYITSVNGNEEQYADTYMTYWSIYTSLYTLDGVTYATSDYGTYDYEGQALGYASYGVTSLPCIEGYTYALVYTTYTY